MAHVSYFSSVFTRVQPGGGLVGGGSLISAWARHSSMADRCGSCQRMPIWAPLPVVAGRPRLFFGVPLIDLFINMGYHKSKPGGSATFRPGSNSSHQGEVHGSS